MSLSGLPAQEISPERVREVIFRTEQRHRVVWTAGRVLKEDGSLHRAMTGDPKAGKRILGRIRSILKALAREGVLAERGPQFNYGTTTEIGYDFTGRQCRKDQVPNRLEEQS